MDFKKDAREYIQKEAQQPFFGTRVLNAIEHIKVVIHGRKQCSPDCARCHELGIDGSRPVDPD